MHVALLAIVLAGCAGAPCGPSDGVVERVIDGDTIVLASGEHVRYLLVDAPETTNGHHDCFGANATQLNSDLVLGKSITLAYDVECTDRYGRLLAYVAVGGVDVNALLVQRGYACVLHVPPDGDARAADFKRYQADAKANLRGLWSACDPLPPAC